MAYIRLRPFLIACASMFTLAWSGLISAFDAVASIFEWHDYVPDARQRLHLDRLGHVAAADPQQGMRRSRSFLERAGLHQLFTGDGFANPQAVGSA